VPHVLLVDDDKDCLTALANRLRFAFRGQHLDVDVADSAATGLILSHAAHYDAIIVDLLMPGVSGVKFVEQLRHTQRNVPVIMISGCEEQTARLGVVACLPKPVDFSELRRLLSEVLEGEQAGTSVRPNEPT
jgi:two-component system response regulator CiaR